MKDVFVSGNVFQAFFKDQITQFAAAFFPPMQRTVSADVL